MAEAAKMFRASNAGLRRLGEDESRDEGHSRLTLKSKKRPKWGDELDKAVNRLKENLNNSRSSFLTRDFNGSILKPEDQS